MMSFEARVCHGLIPGSMPKPFIRAKPLLFSSKEGSGGIVQRYQG